MEKPLKKFAKKIRRRCKVAGKQIEGNGATVIEYKRWGGDGKRGGWEHDKGIRRKMGVRKVSMPSSTPRRLLNIFRYRYPPLLFVLGPILILIGRDPKGHRTPGRRGTGKTSNPPTHQPGRALPRSETWPHHISSLLTGEINGEDRGGASEQMGAYISFVIPPFCLGNQSDQWSKTMRKGFLANARFRRPPPDVVRPDWVRRNRPRGHVTRGGAGWAKQPRAE